MTTTKKLAGAAALALIVIAAPASALARTADVVQEFCDTRYCAGSMSAVPATESRRRQSRTLRSSTRARSRSDRVSHRRAAVVSSRLSTRSATRSVARRASAGIAAQILPHPPGCPPVLFCGCGSALEVFGRHVREAWVARWWLRFPVAQPAPGRVAVRRDGHHVFVIREVLSDNRVLAYDPNSGRRKTRLHVRSLSNYSVRDPRSYASAS